MSNTATASPTYPFFTDLARIINAGQSRSVLLYGNIHDLFHVKSGAEDGRYVPLVTFLTEKCQVKGHILVVYELNGPIRLANSADKVRLRAGWVAWKMATDAEQVALLVAGDKGKFREQEMLENAFDANLLEAIGNPTVALEFLRQLTLCSRDTAPAGKPYLPEDLLIFIEAADMVLPAGNGDISNLNVADRRRVAIVQDWFSDPGFMAGDDSVILLAESASLVHPRVTRMPSVLAVEVAAPDAAAREHYISWFMQAGKPALGSRLKPPKLWGTETELAAFTAGLSVHALRQLLMGAAHSGDTLQPQDVIRKVEDFIASQLGEDVVEFKKPTHTLDDVIGFARLKDFILQELIPRFRSSGPDALSGAAVAGPIGGGKTYIFEAAASALGLPVLVLKNIRSQWFGQTDVIFERLRRTLEALGKVIIVVDEADTQFGGVGPNAHETERRLTGKIQQMMSDPALRGKVIWLLMTARIHLLSPDIRRPGRVGDLIIPVLDPEGADRTEFLRWVLQAVSAEAASDAAIKKLGSLTPGYSAAAFASLRSHLKARAGAGPLSLDAIAAIVHDHIPPAIESARRYQTLQALVNCTRRSLLPDPSVSDAVRESWSAELRKLELMGVQ